MIFFLYKLMTIFKIVFLLFRAFRNQGPVSREALTFRARKQILESKPDEWQHSSQLTNQSICFVSLTDSFILSFLKSLNFELLQLQLNAIPATKLKKKKQLSGPQATDTVTRTSEQRYKLNQLKLLARCENDFIHCMFLPSCHTCFSYYSFFSRKSS